MAGYQPGERPARSGLDPQLDRAAQVLAETDARLAVGHRKANNLSALGISFTLHDVCWLSRSDSPLTGTPRGCHDPSHMAGVTADVRELRCVTTDEIRVHGYDIAYCPRCSCRKTVGSGSFAHIPNAYDEGCTRSTCRCHHNHDLGCYGTGERSETRLCGWDE